MRHAQAQLSQYGINDRERSITLAGMHELDALRPKLRNKLSDVQLVLCSNARRTRQTLDGIRHLLPTTLEIIYEDAIYNASKDFLIKTFHSLTDTVSTVMIVGHNPGLTECVQQVRSFAIPTGSIVMMDVPVNRWVDLQFSFAKIAMVITP